MNNLKKLIIVAALMCSAMLLVACGGGEAEYKVTVKDALGNTYGKDTIVEFYDGDEKVGMQICDENGVAIKKLAKGTYTLKVTSTDKEVSYCFEETQVTESKIETEVVISNKLGEEPEVLFVSGDETDAYYVNAGCTNVELAEGKRSYFLFVPTQAGMYEFSVVADSKTEIGYYGAPHFVQENTAAEVKDGKFSMNVTESMIGTNGTGTTVMVIGVDSDAKENAVLCINRTGDPEKTIAEMEWTIYKKTVELSEYTLPAGKTLVDFDITSDTTYNLVLNKTDGFYHLNNENGPVVVVYLTQDPTVPYLPCFQTVLARSGISKYVFDENDKCIEKISYSECLLEYMEYTDVDTGVYPLTEDLKTIIQERGNYVGWWDSSSPGFIMKDSAGNPIPGLNVENAWLFMCAYVQ
ncbi:MAG: hypothetical protein IJA07_05855 [Agathobacter sp.]|nr:hypothetical protein [Agathobacter sp.]